MSSLLQTLSRHKLCFKLLPVWRQVYIAEKSERLKMCLGGACIRGKRGKKVDNCHLFVFFNDAIDSLVYVMFILTYARGYACRIM